MPIVFNSFGFYELKRLGQGACTACIRCTVRLPWTYGAGLTLKRNEVVPLLETRGVINVLNRKCLCTAHHQNYLNIHLFYVPGIKCTLM